MIWRFLWDEPGDPRWNMAVDEAIALSFSPGSIPTLRLYRWDRPAISFGAFQKIDRALSPAGSSALPVRRITGGRALFHDKDLTYAVVAGTDKPPFSEGISKTYGALAQALLKGLHNVGVVATIRIPSKAERPVRENSGLCFDVTSGYEIAAEGKKLVGSAQRRFRPCFLQQGSLAVEKAPDSFRSENQISLAEILSVLPPWGALQQGFKQGFEEAFSIRLEEGCLTEEERKCAKDLFKKYASDDWTFDRVDPFKNVLTLSIRYGVEEGEQRETV